MAPQSVGAEMYLPWMHDSLPSRTPGPSAALTTALRELARASQGASPPATNSTSSSSLVHCAVASSLQLASTLFIQLVSALHAAWPLPEDRRTVPYFARQTMVGVGGVVVGVVVLVLVGVVLALVVGDVREQVWNPPAAYRVTISLSVAAVASHVLGSS